MAIQSSQAGSAVQCPSCGGHLQAPLPTGLVVSGGNASFRPEVKAFASKKITAGVIGILFGGFGIHKFIIGRNTAGFIMLATWFVCLVTGMCLIVPILGVVALNIIGFIEGIIYLTKSDEDFYQIYAVQGKDWF